MKKTIIDSNSDRVKRDENIDKFTRIRWKMRMPKYNESSWLKEFLKACFFTR